MITNSETIIIGAGLAGLACAVTLEKNDKDFLLIEKSEKVGGRVKTDQSKGFLFDHGFQVLNPGYRQAKALLNLEKLDLNYFDAGFAIRDGKTLRTI
ncbi:MAG: NAD(P)-binding protein, partial [Candidatus Nanopelagicales bacterium]